MGLACGWKIARKCKREEGSRIRHVVNICGRICPMDISQLAHVLTFTASLSSGPITSQYNAVRIVERLVALAICPPTFMSSCSTSTHKFYCVSLSKYAMWRTIPAWCAAY